MKCKTAWVVSAELALGFFLCAQVFASSGAKNQDDASAIPSQHLGYPQDWSSRHLIMTGNDDAAALKAGRVEPRHVYNMVMRRMAAQTATRGRRPQKNPLKVDWSVSLERGYVPANQYPAKFRFDISTESCNGDFDCSA